MEVELEMGRTIGWCFLMVFMTMFTNILEKISKNSKTVLQAEGDRQLSGGAVWCWVSDLHSWCVEHMKDILQSRLGYGK